MANDRRHFFSDFGVFGVTVPFRLGVVCGNFRLVVVLFIERSGVFVDFLLDLRREEEESERKMSKNKKKLLHEK